MSLDDKRPIDPALMRQMEHTARELGQVLERVMKQYFNQSGERWGFALMIFSFEGPEFTWVSNAERADMVKALQEFITRNPPNVTSEGRN